MTVDKVVHRRKTAYPKDIEPYTMEVIEAMLGKERYAYLREHYEENKAELSKKSI